MSANAGVLGVIVIITTAVASVSLSAGVLREPPEDLLLAAGTLVSGHRLGEPFTSYFLSIDTLCALQENENIGQALQFRLWHFPVFFGDREWPRVLINVRKESDGQWRIVGSSTGAQVIHRARKKWPPEEGYRHALLRLRGRNISLLMIEKDDDLQFWFYYDRDAGGDWIFGLSRSVDGSWPAFSKDHLVNVMCPRP